jgi:hypothetical protein
VSAEYRAKLQSLSFRHRQTPKKLTLEGDSREGRLTVEREDRTDVTVYVPPVETQMDVPGWREAKAEAAEAAADERREQAS